MGKRGRQPRYRSLDLGCQKIDGHWIWQGAVGTRGQCVGRDPITGKTGSVHRILWNQMRGELPEAVTVDQTCGVYRCVNPWHYSQYATERSRIIWQRYLAGKAQIDALENDYPWSNV